MAPNPRTTQETRCLKESPAPPIASASTFHQREAMNNPTVILHIRERGHIPSFKNNKMLTKGRLITNPKKQKQMDAITHDLKYALLSLFRTRDEEMPMEPSQLCSIALQEHSMKFDDSVQWLPKITIEAKQVRKGFEGADIYITLLP